MIIKLTKPYSDSPVWFIYEEGKEKPTDAMGSFHAALQETLSYYLTNTIIITSPDPDMCMTLHISDEGMKVIHHNFVDSTMILQMPEC